MAYPPPKELLQLLKAYPPGIQELALSTRQTVLQELVPCHENILEVYTIAMGYGPTARMRDQICHVTVHSKHINLGFNFGAFLPDPDRILIGDGSQIRHIKLHSPADLARPYVRAYLRTALEMADVDDDDADRVKKGVVSVVKLAARKPKAKKPAT
jgi:hypothetical protein